MWLGWAALEFVECFLFHDLFNRRVALRIDIDCDPDLRGEVAGLAAQARVADGNLDASKLPPAHEAMSTS
jgi:hypothetical protein